MTVTPAGAVVNLLLSLNVSMDMDDLVAEDSNVRGVRKVSGSGAKVDLARTGPSALVVADSGLWADLLVASSGAPVHRGERFQYRGVWWIVTGSRRDSGVAVAEPARQ